MEDLLLPRPNGTIKRVLWSHNRNATAVKLNEDWRGRMLIPYGNRIGGAQYSFNGSTYHLPVRFGRALKAADVRSYEGVPLAGQRRCRAQQFHPVRACPVGTSSIPLVCSNSAAPHPYRSGLLWNRTMKVTATSATDSAASVTLQYTFGTDPGYPFLLSVEITYTLSISGFSFVVTASNLDPDGWPLPFYNGSCCQLPHVDAFS